jgi:hypothetical protein
MEYRKIQENDADEVVGRIAKFIHQLPEDVCSSSPMFSQLLKFKKEQHSVELDLLLKERIKYLSASS